MLMPFISTCSAVPMVAATSTSYARRRQRRRSPRVKEDDDSSRFPRHHVRSSFGLVALILAIVSCWITPHSTVVVVSAQEIGTTERNITHGGLVRLFMEYRPESYVSGNPLLIALHGAYGEMRDVLNPAFPMRRLSNQYGGLVLAPNAANLDTYDTLGTNQTWNDGRNDGLDDIKIDDVGFLAALVDWAISQRQVDRRRVYILGVSNGGTMIYRCVLETNPPRYAAAVSMLATLPQAFNNGNTDNTKLPPMPNMTTPLAIMLGTKDKLAQWNGGEFGLGLKGTLLQTITTRDYWIAANQADATKVVKTSYRNKRLLDRCRFSSEYYPPLNNVTGAPVMMFIMEGGGHWVPSNKYARLGAWSLVPKLGPLCREVEGGIIAWNFLSQYKLKEQYLSV